MVIKECLTLWQRKDIIVLELKVFLDQITSTQFIRMVRLEKIELIENLKVKLKMSGVLLSICKFGVINQNLKQWKQRTI